LSVLADARHRQEVARAKWLSPVAMTRWKPSQWRGRRRSGMMRSSDWPSASPAR
jgi:hypothetical protein